MLQIFEETVATNLLIEMSTEDSVVGNDRASVGNPGSLVTPIQVPQSAQNNNIPNISSFEVSHQSAKVAPVVWSPTVKGMRTRSLSFKISQ